MSLAAKPGPLVPASDGPAPAGAVPNRTRDPTGHVDHLCTYIDVNYDITIAVVCSLYICFGILYSFFGYRCFNTVMFLTGFIFGSVIVYLICMQEALMPAYGNVSCALMAGLLFGLITMLVQYVGLFMMGLHLGLLLGLASLIVVDHSIDQSTTLSRSYSTNVWMCVGVLIITAISFAILNLYWRKGLTIMSTSLYGGALFAGALDYFVERLAVLPWIWERVSLKPVVPPPCWFSWIVIAAWPTVFTAGLITQFAVTGTGIYHTDTIGGRKKPTAVVRRPRTREEKAELRQKKYRYLYQVRMAHGDVISQALQKKEELIGESEMGPGECSTLQSDATHLTIPPDLQLTALSESEDDSDVDIATHR